MKYVCYSDDVWHASEIDILYNSHLGKSISNKQSSFLDRGAKLIRIWMRYANHLCIKHRKSNTAWNVSCHVKSPNDQKSWNHLTVNWFNICPNKYSLAWTCYFTNDLSSIVILLSLTKVSFFILPILSILSILPILPIFINKKAANIHTIIFYKFDQRNQIYSEIYFTS